MDSKMTPFGPVVVRVEHDGHMQSYGVMARASDPQWEPTVRGGVDFDCEIDEAWPGDDDSGYNVWPHLSEHVQDEIRESVVGMVEAAWRARKRTALLEIYAHEDETEVDR